MRERGLQRADDDAILALAMAEDRIIVSEDTDFGALLARSESRVPSFVLLRGAEPLSPDERAALLAATLPRIARELDEGCVAVVTRDRVRIRPLPIVPDA